MIKYLKAKSFVKHGKKQDKKKDSAIDQDEFENEKYMEFFQKFMFDLLGEKFHTLIYKDLKYILHADDYLQKII